MTGKGRRKHLIPQLRVVFDTNVLFTGSASDLVQQEAAKLIKESVFPDLEIQWYLPDIVRHERQYQMRKRALALLPNIAKVEKLLGHKLAITEEILVESVERAVTQRQAELGLVSLKLDYGKVEWERVALDAVFRMPPFQDGETEKGFRDRLVAECFLQFVADSPATPNVCRVVMITSDNLLGETIRTRMAESTNVAVLTTLDELKGLINTLVSQVDETFLALLRPKAEKLFFLPKDESTLFYKDHIREKLSQKFATNLATPAAGATARQNGTWLVSAPNFVRKTGRRIQWTSRITIESEASKTITKVPTIEPSWTQLTPMSQLASQSLALGKISHYGTQDLGPVNQVQLSSLLGSQGGEWQNFASQVSAANVVTHKGVDLYEVLWSADVTTNRELRRPLIDDIRYVGTTWEQVG